MRDVAEPGRELLVPVAHRSPVHRVAGVSGPRGTIVSAGGDGTLRSWDAGSGAAGGFVVAWGGLPVSCLTVAGTGDSALVVCADNTAVRRFDLSSGDEVGVPLRAPGSEWVRYGGLGPVAALVDDDVALLVAGGFGGRLHRWEATTGELMGTGSAGGDGELYAVAVTRSRGGRVLMVSSGAGGAVRRWDAMTGEQLGAPLAGNRGPVTALACVSEVDGREVIFGQEYQGPVHRWDAVSGEPIGAPMALGGQGVSRGGLAVTPDGRVLVSLDAGGTPWRWDLSLARPVAEPLPVTSVNTVSSVSTPRGTLFVTGSETGGLQRWDTAGRPVGDALAGHPARVQELIAVVSAAPDRTVLVSGGSDGARCWDAATGRPVGSAPFDTLPWEAGLAAVWLPDGRLMLGSGGSEGILRCAALSGTVVGEDLRVPGDLEPPDDPTIGDVAAGTLPDGRPFFAGACIDGGVYLVDAATGEAVREPLRGLRNQALAVAVVTLPDATVMVAAGGEDRRVLRWDAVTGLRIGAPLTGFRRWVMRLAFRALPDGRVLLVSVDDHGRVQRWDAMSGERIGDALQAPGEPGDAARLAGTAPGHLIAVGRGGHVRCFDGGTGEVVGDITDADSATTVVGTDGIVRLAVGNIDGSITLDRLGH